MSNFDLNNYLYNNPLFEDENKEVDKEIEDAVKDAFDDIAQELPNVEKEEVNEAVGTLMVAGVTMAIPEMMKIIGKITKKVSTVIGRTGNTGEKIIKVADKLHHVVTGVIKKAVKAMGAKEGSTLDKLVDGIYHVIIAALMLASGAGAYKAVKAGKVVMSTLEGALAAVKSNEVGRFLQDLIGSGTLGENNHEAFGSGDEEIFQLAMDVVNGKISYKDAKEKAWGTKELQNAIEDIEAMTGKSAPNYSIEDQVPIHRREEDEDYDADAEQDDENVGMGYDDEGRPLGEDSKDPRQIEAEREMRDQAMVYYIGKLLDKEIDKLPDNPLQAYLDMLTQDQMDHDAETLRRELGEGEVNERLNVSRDALKRLYNEVGATTFSQMILELRDENVLDELVEGMSYQYSGIMNEGLTIGGKKVKAIHTHDSNNVEDHTIEYEDGTEEPYLKHIQMKEARDYRMTYPSYKVEEFNAIGDMAHNGILNLMSFAEQHKPEVVDKIKAVAEEVMNLIYDDMEEFDTQPRISVKEKKGKDHDGDGDIDSDDYLAAKDKAIKKAMKEEEEPTAGQIKSSGGSLASIAGKLAKVAKDMRGLAKEYKAAKEAGDDKKVKDLLATLKVLTAHKKQLEKDLDNA